MILRCLGLQILLYAWEKDFTRFGVLFSCYVSSLKRGIKLNSKPTHFSFFLQWNAIKRAPTISQHRPMKMRPNANWCFFFFFFNKSNTTQSDGLVMSNELFAASHTKEEISTIFIHICVDAGVLIFQIYLENHFSIGCNCFSTKWLPFTSFLKQIAAMILMPQQCDTSEPVNTIESKKNVAFDNGIFGFSWIIRVWLGMPFQWFCLKTISSEVSE